MTPWLDRVVIEEFSEAVARDRSALAEAGQCGALPARAFGDRYPYGCLRRCGHDGPHAPEARSADRLDSAEERRRGRGTQGA